LLVRHEPRPAQNAGAQSSSGQLNAVPDVVSKEGKSPGEHEG
jgi:hypothetical protein